MVQHSIDQSIASGIAFVVHCIVIVVDCMVAVVVAVYVVVVEIVAGTDNLQQNGMYTS